MNPKLIYTHDELMAEPEYSSRNRRGEVLFHGGFDGGGKYISPRSKNRLPAIAAWSAQLGERGAPNVVVSRDQVRREFFPNVAQAQLLLRRGCRDAIAR